MMKETSNKRKEGITLAVVAFIGVVGLVALQFARRSHILSTNDRSVVQNPNQDNKGVTDGQSKIQSVPTSLLHINDQPEINVPFHYQLTDFSPGGVYYLDPGDGAARQPFTNGKLSYTYHKSGTYQIGIYVMDGDNPVKILNIQKEVANLTEVKVLNKKTKKVGFDD